MKFYIYNKTSKKRLYPFGFDTIEECLNYTEIVLERLKKFKNRAKLWYNCKFIEQANPLENQLSSVGIAYCQELSKEEPKRMSKIVDTCLSSIKSSQVNNYLERVNNGRNYARN